MDVYPIRSYHHRGTPAAAVGNDSSTSLQSNTTSSPSSEVNVTKPAEVACVVLLLYTPWCRFTARMAPDYNALGRAFPHLDVYAINTMLLHSSRLVG